MPHHPCDGWLPTLRAGFALFAFSLVVAPTAAQAPGDPAAALLASAAKARDEKSHATAQARYREFLSKFGNHQSAPSARLGLALTLLQFPGEKNDSEARDLLQALVSATDAAEYASAAYHLGLAQRRLGLHELSQAAGKPQEAVQRRAKAQQLFEDAAKWFGLALTAFTDKASPVPADAKSLPAQWEWAARARCDQAEMLLRLQNPSAAQTLTSGFLKDPLLSKSGEHGRGRYLHGFASFLLKDYATAERVLSMLAPFDAPDFGTHARYLLGRTHHLADERAEATSHYEAVLADYALQKKAAVNALKRPDLLAKEPVEKARLEALVKQPPPDHVFRASFHWGVLLQESGRFADAKQRFVELLKLMPASPLAPEAQLRLGVCQVRLKEFAGAVATLQPLVEKDRPNSDQLLFWLGKARFGALPDPKQPTYTPALNAAFDLVRQAAERAQQLSATDAGAKERRAEILLELADMHQQLKQHQEAATLYGQLIHDKSLPPREEELHERLITALHLSGAYDKSDLAASRFADQFPRSTLLPAVLFRHAENSYFRLLAAEKQPNSPERAKELARWSEETAKRYQQLIDRYPEFPQASLARYGLAMTFHRKGELDKARQILGAIPQSERVGELVLVPYVLADCLLRLAPTTLPDDALAAGKLEEQLKSAAQLLDGYVAAQPGSSQTPHALLQLGLCHQRLASLQAQPAEQLKAIRSAQLAYEKLLAPPFAKHPLYPEAVLERAKLLALQGGQMPRAMQELRRFQGELKSAPCAPLALVHLATLLRGQKQAPQAVNVIAQARQWYENDLVKDPQRARLATTLQYHHGVALREAGKLPEARVVFALAMKQGDRPEAAQAALRFGQCLQEEGRLLRERAKKAMTSTSNPDQVASALKQREDGLELTRAAVKFLESHAAALKAKQPAPEARARMLYDIAWAYRDLADAQIDDVRRSRRADLVKQLGPHAKKFIPETPLTKIPVQPAEPKARAAYQALLNDFPDLPLATDARLELAELHAQRDEHDPAIKLLVEALDREPPEALTEKIRLRLGASQAAKGNTKAALAQLNAVAQNPKSPLAGQAHYRIAEIHLANQQFAEAVKRLSLFRDAPQFQNQPGVSDRALLRLGHALAELKQWDPSRQAYELLIGRFGASPWVHEARFGVGWAFQQTKQLDQAVSSYTRVTADSATETAAKAQLQIGLCRLDQKRLKEAAEALLVVPATYDFPELSAMSLLNAGVVYGIMGQRDQAVILFERVLREHPATQWAERALYNLEKLKK
jgi:TolA-binding protein